MSIPSSTLQALQQAGAAVYEADAQLKAVVSEMAQRVHEAVLSNPYHLGNDNLFEHWKIVARMSQTLSGIEQELRKVYQVAGELGEEAPAPTMIPVLAAPQEPAVELVQPIQVTDVRVKRKRAVKPVRAKPALKAAGKTSNAQRLLASLQQLLDKRQFRALNQAAAGKQAGLAPGSISAALRQLLVQGQIVAGPTGQYKLGRGAPK